MKLISLNRSKLLTIILVSSSLVFTNCSEDDVLNESEGRGRVAGASVTVRRQQNAGRQETGPVVPTPGLTNRTFKATGISKSATPGK